MGEVRRGAVVYGPTVLSLNTPPRHPPPRRDGGGTEKTGVEPMKIENLANPV